MRLDLQSPDTHLQGLYISRTFSGPRPEETGVHRRASWVRPVLSAQAWGLVRRRAAFLSYRRLHFKKGGGFISAGFNIAIW